MTICHRDNADNKPYVVETTDIASDGYLQAGHNDHTGPIWSPGMKADHDKWGDIIPPYDYGDFHYAGLNWTTLGQAILSNGCSLPVPLATVATAVFDASTNAAWAGTEQAPSSAYDTAIVSHPAATPAPTGTVTYSFYANNACSGSGTTAGTKNLASGSAPPSDTKSNLAAGSYSFKATYGGDGIFAAATSDCEPFTVLETPPAKTNTTTTTSVFDETTNVTVPLSGTITLGDKVHDTATVGTQVGSNVIGGTVTYYFFKSDTCPSDGATGAFSSEPVSMSAGVVPPSSTQSALPVGSYAYDAVYGGDAHYNGSKSACEPFTVSATYDPSTKTTTTIFNASTNAALTGELTLNGSVYDTSNVTHVGGLTPTGTISYTFWSNNSCTGTGVAAGTNLPLGSKSATEGPLAAGSYSFKANFTSSDTNNFNNSVSPCEPFTVSNGEGGTGEVLAETGANPPGFGLAVTLLILGMFAMGGALLLYRRSAA
ncbi:MAG TPA: Ig-like domain-containing protein [Candidatus Dormibacteraeota bacterium]|nr:Ig-like domain-containing protein [Candidatus Dormibacteraeota bacterium]